MAGTIRIRVPGQWADGWLYKEHLILWTPGGEMYILPMTKLVQFVRQHASAEFALACDYAIFRTDWKGSEQFRRLSTVAEFTKTLHFGFGAVGPSAMMTVKCEPTPVPGDPVPGSLLDASLYANRVYLGSTDGLFETRFDPDKPKYSHPLIRRLDCEISALSTKYSVINASAGELGLRFAPVSFDDTNWWRQDWSFVTTAECSFDNSFASFHVLNYTGEPFPAFLKAETKPGRRRGRAEFSESEVVGYRPTVEIGDLITSSITGAERAEALGNAGNRLLLRCPDVLRVVSISVNRDGDIAARIDRRYSSSAGQDALSSPVLKAHAVGAGFVLETVDGMRLFTPRGSYQLSSERSVRVRTFVNARRHQDTVLAVNTEEVSLYGFLE